MRIGVLGTGGVGQTLAGGFLELGHQVKIGSRTPEKMAKWVEEHGTDASAGTFAEAAAFGEMVVFAVLGAAALDVIFMADRENFSGKVVIDTTNAISSPRSLPPTLFVGHTDSLCERIQRTISDAKVVKAFNIVGHPLMVHPDLPGGPPDMFICGNDESAKQEVTEILRQFGWPTIDLGGIECARYLEPMAFVWIISGARSQQWYQAFKMLRK